MKNIVIPALLLLATLTSFASEFQIPVTEVSSQKQMSFSFSRIDNKTVSLKWSASYEANSNFFEIERSVDGMNWSKVLMIFSSEKESATNSFNYKDKVAARGDIYYRVRTVDVNGGSNYSAAKKVSQSKSNSAVELNIR